MGSAINPYDSDRHSLSDPRSDHFGGEGRSAADTLEKNYTNARASVVALPPPPCHMRGCQFRANHLGACDFEPLETIDLETGEVK